MRFGGWGKRSRGGGEERRGKKEGRGKIEEGEGEEKYKHCTYHIFKTGQKQTCFVMMNVCVFVC